MSQNYNKLSRRVWKNLDILSKMKKNFHNSMYHKAKRLIPNQIRYEQAKKA